MLEIRNLQKIQDGKTVLDISLLDVKAGEVTALVGPVDSGKDILFQLLCGRIQPTNGRLNLAGVTPFHERKTFSQLVGVIFPEESFYKRLSVMENLLFFSRLYHLPRSRVIEVLEQVGMADQTQEIFDKLSPGLCRRLALGRALLNHPRILLLANPFDGCEQVSVTLISRVIRNEAHAGAAVLIVTQDKSHLENLCDRIHILNQGCVINSYDPREEQQFQKPFMVPARSEDRVILVEPAEILFAFAQDDRAYLQTPDGCLSTQFTLAELEKRLSRRGFFRAHRGYLVNLQQVKEVIPFTRDSFSLRLKNSEGTEIPLSKSAERELRELLEY
ncbi:MAG: LytTR family transcriptional regulator DNA-binding domain-containing protein [Chloroflexota bacterium]